MLLMQCIVYSCVLKLPEMRDRMDFSPIHCTAILSWLLLKLTRQVPHLKVHPYLVQLDESTDCALGCHVSQIAVGV